MKYLQSLTLLGLLALVSVSVYSNGSEEISLDVSVGESNTQLSFDQIATGYTLVGSNQSDCNFDGPDLCEGMWSSQILTESPVIDEVTTLENPGYFQLSDDSGAVNFSIAKREVPASEGFVVVEFLNKLWFLGGRYPNRDETSTTIWSSADGWSWIEEYVADTLFPRTSFNAVVFKGQLWVIGGLDVNYLSARDVWKSSDGITWDLVTEDAGFVPGKVVAFNDRLWSIGGWEKTSDTNRIITDIWSSADGINWRRELAGAEFLNRSKFEVAVYQGRIWLTGGGVSRCPSSSNYSDTWYTEDGISWHEAADIAGYPSRCGHRMLTHNGQLYIVGGASSNQYLNDVWVFHSENGWLQATGDAGYMERLGSQVLSYKGKLWTFGGKDRASIRHSDIWSSGDGIEWKSDELLRFPLRYDHQSVSFKDRLWVIGGQDFTEYWHNAIVTGLYDSVKSDIWSSVEGFNWVLEMDKPVFSDRYGHQVVEFQDSLWLIGGKEGRVKVLTAGAPLNDIWKSDNGVDWALVTESADFPAVSGHQVAKFKDALWMTGGKPESSSFSGGIWNSQNGIDWNYLEANKDFSTRFNHKMVVFNNKLFLIGGYEIDPETGSSYLNDIWSSEDGINWTLEREDGGFPATYSHEIVSFNNRLWLYGGISGSINEAIWSSDNGVDWIKERENTPFGKVFGARITAHGDSLILTGGRGEYRENRYVWSSQDGISWKRIYSTSLPKIRPRSTVSSNVNGGGYVYPHLDQVIDYSMPAEFVINAEEGNHLVLVEGCGGTLFGDRFFIPSVIEDCVVDVLFEQIEFDVSTVVSDGGNIVPMGPVSVEFGDTATFDISPLDAFEISSVEGCGGVLVGHQYITGIVTDACQIDVDFMLREYVVNVVVGAGGAISGSHLYKIDHGDFVTFTITPDEGYTLDKVSGCNGSLVNDVYTTDVITGECSIYVDFHKIRYNVEAVSSDGGLIEPSGITQVMYGDNANFIITPGRGFELTGVTGCPGQIVEDTFVTSEIYSDCKVIPSFELKRYSIETIAGVGGRVLPELASSVRHGEKYSVSIKSDPGYQIDTIAGCVGSIEGDTFTIPSVEADCILTASFSRLDIEIVTAVTAGGKLTPTGPFYVPYGTDFSILVVPDFGYRLDSITGCLGALNEGRFDLENVVDDCWINASFTPVEYVVSVELFKDGEKFDTLIVDGFHGVSSELDIPDIDGYEFVSEQGCDGVVSGTSYVTAALTQNCVVRLYFARKKHLLTIEVVGSGTVSVEDVLAVSDGDSLDIALSPDSGYSIGRISGCLSSLSESILSVGPITESCLLVIEFASSERANGVVGEDSLEASEPLSSGDSNDESGRESGSGAFNHLALLLVSLILFFIRWSPYYRRDRNVLNSQRLVGAGG